MQPSGQRYVCIPSDHDPKLDLAVLQGHARWSKSFVPQFTAMAESSCTVTCQLRRSTYVAGELVTGLINVSIPHSTESCTVEVLEASVRAHGHARVDPRWIALPRPLQTLYGHNEEPAPPTDAAGAAVRQRPRYKDVDDANTVCIYSTDSVTIPLQLEPQADSTPDAAAADSEAAAKPETAVGASPPNVQTFTFSFRAPQDLPPTYRGVVVKYFYMATVSIVIARHTAASAGWGVR
eukprot:10066-Heterococcus_DN1.PRE.1